MADFKIKKNNEFDTKELKVFEMHENKTLVLGVNGENGRESMWVGISLNEEDVKQLIDFLQKQIS